jgi:formate C-acetyltransferase
VFDRLSAHINNVPNVKGGVYRLGILSIDWRKTWGENTAASADGRYAGETLSQNASATFGMDKEGPTGHILSVASMDGTNAVNGLVLDIDMHSSAVRGENGTNVLVATLETMLRVGAQTVHYNILDTQILRDAQVNPEKYPNLQVRMCGWNVLFTHLSKKSQDEFIRRSEMLAG